MYEHQALNTLLHYAGLFKSTPAIWRAWHATVGLRISASQQYFLHTVRQAKDRGVYFGKKIFFTRENFFAWPK